MSCHVLYRQEDDTVSKLNGSVDLLAKAMKEVFSEVVEGDVGPLQDDIDSNKGPATKKDRETTSEHIQSQPSE